jgi:hypothetical protein
MAISAFYGGLGPPGDKSNTPLDQNTVNAITGSGFNTVIISLFHIGRPGIPGQALGDIVFNSPDIVATNGEIQTGYVGSPGSDWAYYLTQLKAGGIEKIYLSFGGGDPVEDYTTIANSIMQYEGPGNQNPYIPESSNLYQNFLALKTYLPMVDGIDIDQEESSGQAYTDAMTAFGNMALSVGFNEITLVPPWDNYLDCYKNAGCAIASFGATLQGSPGITRIGLQLYGGCSVNAWTDVPQNITNSGGNSSPVPVLYVGATAQGASPADINNTFYNYLPTIGSVSIDGGFIWEYNYISDNLSCYLQAMNDGLNGNNNWPPASGPCSSSNSN